MGLNAYYVVYYYYYIIFLLNIISYKINFVLDTNFKLAVKPHTADNYI